MSRDTFHMSYLIRLLRAWIVMSAGSMAIEGILVIINGNLRALEAQMTQVVKPERKKIRRLKSS